MADATQQEILLEIKNLKKEYRSKEETVVAIENLDLEIRRGEFLCVLGPSGCGKSTLLKILAGYQEPTSGMATMEGDPIQGPDWHRGVVFQSPTLYPWMSVRENVEFGPRMRNLSEEEIEEIRTHFLEQVKLTSFKDSSTFELSGGMKQRVALARALANYPQVILMDEPFGALDALTRANMQTLTRDIWKENNSTFFLITHDIDEALMMGTRIVVMSKRPGRIIKEFSTDFTHTIHEERTNHVIYSEDYFELKQEILSMINSQIE